MYYDVMTPIRHPLLFASADDYRDSRQITLEGQTTEKSLSGSSAYFLIYFAEQLNTKVAPAIIWRVIIVREMLAGSDAVYSGAMLLCCHAAMLY